MSTEGALWRPLTSNYNSITSDPIMTLGLAMGVHHIYCVMWKRFGNVLCYVWKIQRDASSIMIQNIKDYSCEGNTFAIVEMTNNKNCKESTTTHFLIKKIFSGLADNSFIRGKMLKGLVWDKILQLARWQVVETLPLVGGTMDNAVSCLPRCSWPFPLTAAEQIRQHTKTSKRTQT